jgi:hypothetical protein
VVVRDIDAFHIPSPIAVILLLWSTLFSQKRFKYFGLVVVPKSVFNSQYTALNNKICTSVRQRKLKVKI